MDFLVLLTLIVIANSTPVLLKDLFGQRFAWPLDGGFTLADGRPLFGNSKTLRGVLFVPLVTAVAALPLGLDLTAGVLMGIGAMFGDLLSSFIKRRLNKAPSTQAIFLDQIPESLLPLLLVMDKLDLDWSMVVSISLVFMVLEMIASPLLYKLKLRDRPY